MSARPPNVWNRAGFTLVELVLVLILVGILSFVALPRLTDQTLDMRGYADAAKAALQHARKVAVASRHFVCVNVVPTSPTEPGKIVLRLDPRTREGIAAVNCTADVKLPAPAAGCAASNEVCVPNGVQLAGASLVFDPLGRVVTAPDVVAAAAGLSVSLSGGLNPVQISIVPETGYTYTQ